MRRLLTATVCGALLMNASVFVLPCEAQLAIISLVSSESNWQTEQKLALPATATFCYPQGPKGWYVNGFRKEHDGTRDWRGFYGLQLEIWTPKGRDLQLEVTLSTPPADPRQEHLPSFSASIPVASSAKSEWQRVTVPLSAFGVSSQQWASFKYIQSVKIGGKFGDDKKGEIRFKNVRLVKAPIVALEAPVKGKSLDAGQTARYEVIVSNTTDTPQTVNLRFEKDPFSMMVSSVGPSQLKLASGASARCIVSVQIPEKSIAIGGHENQKLAAFGTSGKLAEVEFITARDVQRPSILHTAARWDDVRAKVLQYDWAKTEQAKLLKIADDWNVPEASLPPNNFSVNEKHAYVFKFDNFPKLQSTAFAWQLTRDRKYAEKVALFLRRLSDPKTGYPSTFAGMDQGGPQEGQYFQNVALSYDAILDSGLVTAADKANFENTARLYMETFEVDLTQGNMGNWGVAQSTACLMLSLAIGDLERANRYIYGPCGWTDFLSKGVMDDGWWWECSTGYNGWVATELTQSALALQPWGIDLVHSEIPANFSPYAIFAPWALNPPYGISFEKWGPNRRNTRSLKHFWDAVPPVADYRGIVSGTNDGHEEQFGGQRMELAYMVYRDPAYATLIKQGDSRDLIYGVPELPEKTTELFRQSSFAENIGTALLRSQTEGREPREQIQSVLKIGTQGGFHGHFDRTALNNITRYGRSFWNPETVWWGYPNFMYKFFVQTSVSHNMVVVDGKQQEAVPSSQLLFHSGKMMQVAAQETKARWSDPPFGGMQYFEGEKFIDRQKLNKQSVPIVADRKFGEMGPFSDRVTQRRLEIVTDDYIVLADYLKGEQEHTFDNLFQMKSMQSLEAPDKKFVRHDAQYDSNPRSSGQFITDANWYSASAPAVAKFEFPFGPNADNSGTREFYNEAGTLKIDVHSLWPQQQQIMTAMPPEDHGVGQWVNYSVGGDGKELAKGESGIWILGAVDVDVPVSGLKELTLSVQKTGGKKKALFWGNARLVTADGREIPLSELQTTNVDTPKTAGQDYYGGPIKIAGNELPNSIATQPIDDKSPALIRVPLTDKNAVRFKATLGGDYPFGPEAARRKVYGIRSQGREARFLTVLEPYEKGALVKSAIATGPDSLRVELSDGRVQELTISNLNGDGKNIAVQIRESRDGKVVRSENSGQ